VIDDSELKSLEMSGDISEDKMSKKSCESDKDSTIVTQEGKPMIHKPKRCERSIDIELAQDCAIVKLGPKVHIDNNTSSGAASLSTSTAINCELINRVLRHTSLSIEAREQLSSPIDDGTGSTSEDSLERNDPNLVANFIDCRPEQEFVFGKNAFLFSLDD